MSFQLTWSDVGCWFGLFQFHSNRHSVQNLTICKRISGVMQSVWFSFFLALYESPIHANGFMYIMDIEGKEILMVLLVFFIQIKQELYYLVWFSFDIYGICNRYFIYIKTSLHRITEANRKKNTIFWIIFANSLTFNSFFQSLNNNHCSLLLLLPLHFPFVLLFFIIFIIILCSVSVRFFL